MEKQQDISRVITNLRFPLIVGVVFIHSGIFPLGMDDGQLAVLSFIEQLFTKFLPRFCVPMFFMIAGYLFFAKCEKASVQFFVKQYKKRFKSLVIPYVFWNAVVIAIFWMLHRFVPMIISSDFENVANYPPPQLLNCFWKGSGGFPIAYQFWFVRELIVSVALSPIVYLLLAKRKKKLLNGCAIALIAIYTTAVLAIENIRIPINYFFVLGAFFALHKIDFVYWSKRLFVYALPISLIALCFKFTDPFNISVDGMYILSFSVVAIEIARRLKTVNMTKLAESSFFIYAYHGIVILMMTKLLSRVITCYNQLLWLMIYLIVPIIIILVGYIFHKILKRYLPNFTALITGGR